MFIRNKIIYDSIFFFKVKIVELQFETIYSGL